VSSSSRRSSSTTRNFMKPKGKSSYCDRTEPTSQQQLLPGSSASFACSLQSYCCGWYQSQVGVGGRERERERERERVQVYGYVAGQASEQPREREMERVRARGGGGSRGRESRRQRWWERGIAREQEGEELYPRNLEKPTLFIPTHPLAPPIPTSVATLWTSAY